MRSLADLMATHARDGCLTWIGIRPARRAEMVQLSQCAVEEAGLEGDHGRAGKRAVTLIQAEHLPVVAALCDGDVRPEVVRRNLVVSGLNLAALRGRDIAVGRVVLRVTGPCASCSRMEEALGRGGYSAMRHHGGWCASVVRPGQISVGDALIPC